MFDIKIKKGLNFQNEYIHIKNDNLYITDYTRNILSDKFGDKFGYIKRGSRERYLYTLFFRPCDEHNILHVTCGDYCYSNYYNNKLNKLLEY